MAKTSQANIQAAPPQGTSARKASHPNTCRAYRLKLNKNKPSTMSQPADCNQRDAPQNRNASPMNNKPSE